MILSLSRWKTVLRVVDKIEKEGRGLNLTFEVRNGIERHTSGEQAATLEGRVVRLADRIAYINHDIDDATIAGIMCEEDIPLAIRNELGHSKSARINTLVISCIEHSGDDIGKNLNGVSVGHAGNEVARRGRHSVTLRNGYELLWHLLGIL